MGYGRGKDSKSKKSKKKKEEPSSSSESESDQSYSSDSSYTSSSDSEPEQAKKKRLDSTTKKKQKKEKRKEEKRKKKEAKNKISKDDFYNKSTEFRLWLVEEKSKYFDQLSNSKSRSYFKKFVKQWNSRKLAKKYYKGIDMADARASLTKYKWKFAEKMKKSDKNTPSPGKIPSAWKSTPTAMSPPERTFSTFGKAGETGTIGPSLPAKRPTLQHPTFCTFGKSVSTESIGPNRPVQGPAMPPSLTHQVSEEDLRDAKKRLLRKERKDFREHHKMVLEELSPKATGHDAKVEKKKARAQDRRQREDSPDADTSYMGAGDDIQRRLAARQKQRDQKRVQATTKLEEYQAREKAKMSKLLELARANKSKDALW